MGEEVNKNKIPSSYLTTKAYFFPRPRATEAFLNQSSLGEGDSGGASETEVKTLDPKKDYSVIPVWWAK